MFFPLVELLVILQNLAPTNLPHSVLFASDILVALGAPLWSSPEFTKLGMPMSSADSPHWKARKS